MPVLPSGLMKLADQSLVAHSVAMQDSCYVELERSADWQEGSCSENRDQQGRGTEVANRIKAAEGTAQIHSIEISDRRLCGSSESVSLTANYRTTFSLAGDPLPDRRREATDGNCGSKLVDG